MLSQWRLWYYAIIGFLIQAVLAGCIFFVPLIIDSMFTGALLKLTAEIHGSMSFFPTERR